MQHLFEPSQNVYFIIFYQGLAGYDVTSMVYVVNLFYARDMVFDYNLPIQRYLV
jgi:hypothetical protein